MLKVFIADDSDVLRGRVIDLLSELPNVKVIGQARNGVEAASSVYILKPDVVILDIRMAEGNGISALKDIKQYDIAPVVIMFTNYPNSQYKKKCLENGADFFFDKSTEFEDLIETCKNLAVALETG